jgi:hypothetical protein
MKTIHQELKSYDPGTSLRTATATPPGLPLLFLKKNSRAKNDAQNRETSKIIASMQTFISIQI